MRKADKEQAAEFLKVLGSAHSGWKKLAEADRYDAACDMLYDCQQGAVRLGNMIESSEGEDFVIVRMIGNYCEWIYQIYEKLHHYEADEVISMYEESHKLLAQIADSLEHEVKIRWEVVFLPYKASMWDSLESVWKAAEADEECDAYVIPVPYYDKHPDGTFGEYHYEKDLFPEYVPVTNYLDYDFGGHRPDMIFIHNPYDEYNYVTSVDPFFYSGNLKKYTQRLVYIPYFILEETDPDNGPGVEGIAHFCTCPAVYHADRVIVQSEAMRQIYIRVLSDADGSGDRKQYWEKKILGTGSPKSDGIMDIRKEKPCIPDEWMDKIRKVDGSWKKIVFYNTSISTLLQYNDKMIEKIINVFCIFREIKDEVTLLWRPHPLLKATISSMRPRLWQDFQNIVAQYREEGWGIYDDSPDIDRAVALSDAYYGDSSSVVQLCKKAGVPVMIQNV